MTHRACWFKKKKKDVIKKLLGRLTTKETKHVFPISGLLVSGGTVKAPADREVSLIEK